MPTLLSVPIQPLATIHRTFSGHETFPFRYAWLKKGIDGLQRRSDIFSCDDAMVELGVGKNMVCSIRHWCLATRVFEEGDTLPNSRSRHITPSAFGRALFIDPGWDTYLQDDATLWLLHWQLATNETRSATWYWAFNHLREHEFSLADLEEHLGRWAQDNSRTSVSSSSLASDVFCFLRTYVSTRRGPQSTAEETLDCPLTTLGLISELPPDREGGKRYRFNNSAKSSLMPAIFTYALLDCWNNRHTGQTTLSLREITRGEGSPGRIFRLNEDHVLSYLDKLKSLTGGRLVFKDDGLIRQVVRNGDIHGREILDAYYSE